MPNPLNYPTLPACQKLAEKGIVMETDAVYERHVWPSGEEWRLILKGLVPAGNEIIPAPSLAEVWRELPSTTEIMELVRIYAQEQLGEFWQAANPIAYVFDLFRSIDRMVDLLIWVRERKEKV